MRVVTAAVSATVAVGASAAAAITVLATTTAAAQTPPVSDYRTAGAPATRLFASRVCSVQLGTAASGPREGFTEVAGATRLSTGVIVVLEHKPRELIFFDSTGRFMLRAGRAGGGPGEFASQVPALYPYRGDSVAVYDGVARGVHVFSSAGRFGRTFALVRAADRPVRQERLTILGASTADGSIAAALNTLTQFDAGVVVEDSVRFVWFDADGKERARSPLVTNAYATRVAEERSTGPGRRSVRMMAPGAVSRAGAFPRLFPSTAVVRGGPTYHFQEPLDALAIYSGDGRISRLVLLPPVARAARPATGRVVPQSDAQLLEMFADNLGRAWVEIARDKMDGDRVWWVFDASGRRIAEAASANPGVDRNSSRILEIGGDYLLQLKSDSDGVQTVQVCAIGPR